MNIFIKLQELKRNLLKIENIFFLTLIFTLFLLDRYSKNLILNYNDSRLFINDFLNIDLIWNTGIGFGFLSSESTVIYNCITLLIGFVILILIYTSLNANKLEKFTFSIILGGALGNFYDRVVFKAVPDWTQTKVRSLLGNLGFSNDDVYKKVLNLSGGEKARIALALIIIEPCNKSF